MNKIVFENPNALANFFANELVTLSANKQRVNIALSGGATPKLLFHILATDYAHIDWSNMHFFWGDERCVLPTDDESNYKIANQLFLIIVIFLLKTSTVSPVRKIRMKKHFNMVIF